MNGKVFGISFATIALVLIALIVGYKFGSKIPLVNAV